MRLVTPRNADAHTLRMDRLRRDRAASQSLRVAFPSDPTTAPGIALRGCDSQFARIAITPSCIRRQGHFLCSPALTRTAMDSTT